MKKSSTASNCINKTSRTDVAPQRPIIQALQRPLLSTTILIRLYRRTSDGSITTVHTAIIINRS